MTRNKINYDALYERIGYRFKNAAVLVESLCHSSALKKEAFNHFERREFLGDRVIGLCLAEVLLENFSQKPEGYLAKQLSFFASKDVMAELASQIGLQQFLKIGKSAVEKPSTQISSSILADSLEALFGAIYLDGGFSAAQAVFKKIWMKKLEDETSFENLESKSKLQEWSQAQGYSLPIYEVLDSVGPDHAPTFFVEVKVGETSAVSEGPSKKAAEQLAAKKLLEKLLR